MVKLQHTSEACPTANAEARERMVKGAPEIPKLARNWDPIRGWSCGAGLRLAKASPWWRRTESRRSRSSSSDPA